MPNLTLLVVALIVLNKSNQADSEIRAIARQEYPQTVLVLATKGLGLDSLQRLNSLQQRLLQLVDQYSFT